MPEIPLDPDKAARPQCTDWTRREFLQTGAAAAAGLAIGAAGRTQAAPAETDPLSFFVIADTHYLASRDEPAKMNPESVEVTDRLVRLLNELPGQPLPENVGGGTVNRPRGVINAGDLVDSGDKHGPLFDQMTATEWRAYVEDMGLTGTDGRLRYPVYEVHGNHDSPRGRNVVIQGIIDRNRRRPGVKNVSGNGLHYSWDWGGLHFVALGIVVGADPAVSRERRYHPYDSLAFLADDLKRHVGDSGRPVVVVHHIDVLRYSRECDEQSTERSSAEWDACDVRAYYRVLQGYNVAAVFHGHLHGRTVFQWDGGSRPADSGIRVFGANNAGAHRGAVRGFFYCRVEDAELVVREYETRDAWATAAWTPTVWRAPLGKRVPGGV